MQKQEFLSPRRPIFVGGMASLVAAVILTFAPQTGAIVQALRWVIAGLLYFCALVSPIFLVFPPRLVLDAQGFYRVSPFRRLSSKTLWRNVERFEIIKVAGYRRLSDAVGVVWQPGHKPSGPIIPLLGEQLGAASYVSLLWPKPVNIIVAEMNDYRNRALGMAG